jgi:hypothetical protein
VVVRMVMRVVVRMVVRVPSALEAADFPVHHRRRKNRGERDRWRPSAPPQQ